MKGRAAVRHFINIASLGLSGPTSRAVNKAKRSGKASGQLLFMWHTIRELIRYRFQDVRISVDGAPAIEARIAVAAAANGRFFGGGMMIAPQAELEDGLLDLVIFRGAAKLTLIKDMRLLYSGSHVNHPAVTMLRGRKIIVEPAGDSALNTALLDIDGECPAPFPPRSRSCQRPSGSSADARLKAPYGWLDQGCRPAGGQASGAKAAAGNAWPERSCGKFPPNPSRQKQSDPRG